MDRIRIGTRGSKLALKQAALVQEALLRAAGFAETELVILPTRGDRIQDKPLSEIGEKGVFASELEQALLDGRIDAAVHSAKDLPMTLADGLEIAAVLPRADVRDVLVIPKDGRMPTLRSPLACMQSDAGDSLFMGQLLQSGTESACTKICGGTDSKGEIFRVGSGSRRRQLLAGMLWENVACENIRGNVDTRLRKLQEGGYDGIILAKAGLDRLGIGGEKGNDEEAFCFCPLSPKIFIPAACQGIIAVETMRDSAVETLCRKVTDAETELCFRVEREALWQLAADCSEAAAAWCRQECDRLTLHAMYAGQSVRLECRANLQEGRLMAEQAAKLLKAKTES